MQVLRKAFTEPLDPALIGLVSSVQDDAELIVVDVLGSIAHCTMLATQGLISPEQSANIKAGLKAILVAAQKNEFVLSEQFEDVHMNVEKQLEALIGEDALRLHTARSRNDQVALDFRLYVSAQIEAIKKLLSQLQNALVAKAAEYPQTVMPGYTHLQRAQPILFSHALHAFFEMLARDVQRFEQMLDRVNISPLGAGAQAGSSLPIDPALTAALLGLNGTFKNSIDAVSDRDFAAEFLMASSLCSIHLSQLCETLIIWNTAEFNFVKFADSVTTSSSLMPQKKNPDPLEIVRGRAGLAVGELVNMLVTLKGLPLGYNRDLQETKTPVIKVAKSLSECLDAVIKCVASLSVQSQVMFAAASDADLIATDVVEYLVDKSVPFRKAHEITAEVVSFARQKCVSLDSISLTYLKSKADQFDSDYYELFNPLVSANKKVSHGGTAHGDPWVSSVQEITPK